MATKQGQRRKDFSPEQYLEDLQKMGKILTNPPKDPLSGLYLDKEVLQSGKKDKKA